jgi:biotin synthase
MNTLSDLQSILTRVYESPLPEAADLEYLLSLEEQTAVETLFSFADNVRRQHMGDGILLRGIVEFSSFCRNTCYYCGLNRNNAELQRYRLTQEELLKSVAAIASSNIRTVVLQSGEDDGLAPEWLAEVIREIKIRFDMAVTLSIGERPMEDYRLWRESGADRYLLKIETSDKALYETMHPNMSFENRLRCLRDLRALGYQVGSGSIVGLKRQTAAHIANDIRFFKSMGFDMIGIGPFIPHGSTEFRGDQPGSVQMTLKTVALTRIVTKTAHLPATTALGSIDVQDYRVQGLKAGANVLMPNFTPQPYRQQYEIYPGKRCVNGPVGACSCCMEGMAASIGRHIDHARGDALRTG